MIRLSIVAAFLCLAIACLAQETPELRVNILNVCNPKAPETAELSAALARIPPHPVFGPDYEIARGRTTGKKTTSNWVRMRREFAREAVFSNVQFLLTVDPSGIDETLVLHARESKPGEPLEISFEDHVSVGTAAEVLAADTPPSHIRLERFGKGPVVLARCANVSQDEYEPLFSTAASLFSAYRTALNVRTVVGKEFAQFTAAQQENTRHGHAPARK